MPPLHHNTTTSFAIVALALLVPLRLHAHGTPPRPLQVLRTTPHNAPDVVLTSIGVAYIPPRHQPQTTTPRNLHNYACPSSWGHSELDTPLSLALPSGDFFIAGFDHLYHSTDSLCTLTPITDPSAPKPHHIADMIYNNGKVWGISNTPAAQGFNATLWTWTPSEGIHTLQTFPNTRLSSIVGNQNTLLLTAREPNPQFFTISTAPPYTQHASNTTLPTPNPLHLTATHFQTPSTVWLRAVYTDRIDILISEDLGETWETRISATETLNGPIPLCGGYIFRAENRVVPDPISPPSCSIEDLESPTIDCLDVIHNTVYLCQNQTLYRVQIEDNRAQLASWFRLSDIQGLDETCTTRTADEQRACEEDWRDEGTRAGLITTSPNAPNPTDPSPTTRASSSMCSTQGQHRTPRSSWAFTLMGALVAIAGYQRRRTAGIS